MINFKRLKVMTMLISSLFALTVGLSYQVGVSEACDNYESVEVKIQKRYYAAASKAGEMLKQDNLSACYFVEDVEQLLRDLSYEKSYESKVYTVEINDFEIYNNIMKVNYVELIDSQDMERLKEVGYFYEGYEASGQYEYYDDKFEDIGLAIDEGAFCYILDENAKEYIATHVDELSAYEGDNCFQIAVANGVVVGILEQYIE